MTFESEVLRHYDALIYVLFLKTYQNKNKLSDLTPSRLGLRVQKNRGGLCKQSSPISSVARNSLSQPCQRDQINP